MASIESAIGLETKQNPGDMGQSERLDRAKQLEQNQIKYIPKEHNKVVEKDPNAAGSHASTASTGGAGEKTRKRTGDGQEPHGDKIQLNTISVSENSKPMP